ncbi:hypothetical protein [Chryseolinea soli]|uniref:Uncharacterized protein n=1 Tax=Chryseolinea soli TaxID=2321403 RepID=A0A385SUI9_9BACT|nr:hypothetical protein [Chryseolinea soli]AYB33797.1 hypothetical protein D4L85_25875 [Chryseolinea soli]
MELLTQVLPLSLNHSGNSFTLVIGDQAIQQSTCEFLLTYSSMVGTDIEAYLKDLSNASDKVNVPLSGKGNAVVLSLRDFARLRTLYGQMMYELKLQDLLIRSSIFPQSTLTLSELN